MEQEDIIDLIEVMIARGRQMAAVRRRLLYELPLNLTEDDVNRAEAEFESRAGIIRSLPEPRVAADRDLFDPWYTGPRGQDLFWPSLRSLLSEDLLPPAVNSIDQASTKIVSYLAPPGTDEFHTRGLVLGFVQSGKTTNFASVIAKAADAGYRLFIVLSGMHNSLRAQTQVRLERYLHEPNPNQWYMLSDAENDFVNPGHLNANRLLADVDTRLLIVVKKNAARLRAVSDWLSAADPEILRKVPILVVDDEADQASIDTSPIEDREKRTRINGLIIKLIDQPKASYVGYTASPFANLLIDPSIPKQLYPRDFIVDLPIPEGYFGPEKIYGRERLVQDEEDWESEGLDIVRVVPDEDVALLRPPRGREAREAFAPDVPSSLSEALKYFVLATAARRYREGSLEHSTMLVHTTLYSDIQHRMRQPILSILDDLGGKVDAGDSATIRELEELWMHETSLLPAAVANPHLDSVPFDALLGLVGDVIAEVEVKVDNYKSEDRLDYTGNPRTVIAIGGNTLSRGLTLEGLVVSYFIRTASAYDTLLQMGRWFGYRQGYEDLPRIWMTKELEEQFMALATVEAEIRDDIARYEAEDLTPREVAVKIRTHPKLAVTAAMKMQSAVETQVSYSGRHLQTILFNHRDRQWLASNLDAARQLIRSGAFVDLHDGRWLGRDVPVDRVIGFLSQYKFHEEARDLRSEPLIGYIQGQRRQEELNKWNVGVLGLSGFEYGSIDLGLPREVGLIRRSNTTQVGYANIKTLMSRRDRVMDLDLPREIADGSWKTQVPHRPAGVGLLLLYPIWKDSFPTNAEGMRKRFALDAVEDVIGVGVCFPKASRSETAQTYVAAPLEVDYMEDDHPDIEDTDAA